MIGAKLRLSFLGLCAVAAGCGKDDGRVDVFPVSGKVLAAGQPAEGAKVVFYPEDPQLQQPGMPVPYAFAGPDGSFRLRSYDPDDGAPAGEYNISVYWPGPPRAGATEEEMKEAKDRLGNRYLDPKKSGLHASIKAGDNELPPLELK
jgi:hypothetical protein